MRATWVGAVGVALVVLGIVAMTVGAAIRLADPEPTTVVVSGTVGVAGPLGPESSGGDLGRQGAADDGLGRERMGGGSGQAPGVWGGGPGPGIRGGPLPSPGGSVRVSFDGSAFVPKTIAVRAGGTVTWRNDDTRIHSVAAADGTWSSGDLLPGATFSRVFATAGRFPFYSPDHPGLRGVVVVAP